MRPRLAEALVVMGVLSVFLVYVAPTLRQPLLERHEFRQTQTAYTARIYHEEGIALAHPKLPVLGEPFEIPFEFPLFQAGASIVMDLGVADDTAMRTTGLVCFLATALLLFGLVRHVAGRTAAVASLVAFTLTPFALLWSRTSMIEYLATAGAVGFTWALVVWRESRRPLIGGLALAAGLIGMLVKPTTAIFWIIPALAYRPSKRRTFGRRLDVVTAAIVAIPIVAAVAWTRHADSIKAASPATEWLTSRALREWTFGTFEQRFSTADWREVGERVAFTIVRLLALFLPAAVLAMWRTPQRLFWLGIASAAVLPPVVFTNLYFVHDYYLAAVTPAIAALTGLGAGYIWDHLPQQPLVRVAAAVAALLIVWVSLEDSRWYWHDVSGGEGSNRVLSLAKELESQTRPGDLVAIQGLDWSPAVLYYAHRRGHMVPPANRDFAYELIHDTGYRHLLVSDPPTADLGFLSLWSWVGALEPHMYSIADSAGELPPSDVVATNAGMDVRALLRSGVRLAGTKRVRCGAPVQIPSGDRGTWIRFARPTPGARLAFSDALAPVPARSAIFVARQLTEQGRLRLTCTGARSLDVVEVVDAEGP